MERIIQTVVEAVLGLRGVAAYAVVGGLAFGEAAAFVGLITPGEVAMVLGGVLVSQNRAALGLMCGIAAVAAVTGDSAGYWLGRRYGVRLLDWPPLADRFGDRVDGAMDYIREHGGRAVIFGRWASVVRTFVPFGVGMTGMSYRRFVMFSVPAAASWALVFVLLGYAAGASWEVVQGYAGRASLVLLIILVIAVGLRLGARKVIANRERLIGIGRRLGRIGWVRALRARYGRQLRWLADRFNPRVAGGLGLTLGFLILVTAGIAAGVILNDVQAFRGLARLDAPVRGWFEGVRTDTLAAIADIVVAAFRLPWLLVPTAAVAGFGAWHVAPRLAIRIVVGGLGAAGIALLVNALVTERIGTGFPSASVTVAAALVVHLVATLTTRLEWAAAVTTAAVGTFAVSLVGLAVLVLGTGTLSGVVFGAVLGVAWAAGVEVQARLPFRLVADTSPVGGDVRSPTR